MTEQATFVERTPEEKKAWVVQQRALGNKNYKPRPEWIKENQDKIRLSIIEDILKRNNLK